MQHHSSQHHPTTSYRPITPRLQFHKTYTLPSGSLADDYHVYGLKWGPFGITTYIDTPSNVVLQASFDQPMFGRGPTAQSSSGGPFYPASGIDDPWASSPNPNACPFDQEFYLIMNVAVGGTANYFPDGFGEWSVCAWRTAWPWCRCRMIM